MLLCALIVLLNYYAIQMMWENYGYAHVMLDWNDYLGWEKKQEMIKSN